ncbi:MAG: Cysteine desulfurase [Candidatus Hinthialibacteria bacterium OLB16]|nr:MAG: Cysteine desulfurase [Candidatus Hinthialibacteria bacterium OLB16]
MGNKTAKDSVIYMDNHATTPIDPRVLEEMLPTFTVTFGNAASRNHAYGWEAEDLVDQARDRIARLLNCTSKEIIFTSGATESNNLAIKGVAQMYREKGNHIITVVTEHKAVLDPCKRLESEGFEVTWLPVRRDGLIDMNQLADSITDKTILVSIMTANNEIGVIQPIEQIGRLCKEKDVLFHTDATQAVGKIPLNVEAMGIDLLSVSAHKLYGPKGAGALYVRRRKPRVRLTCQMDGGGHERGMRSGTLNVSGIVGLGKACDLAREEMQEESSHLSALRDRLQSRFTSSWMRSISMAAWSIACPAISTSASLMLKVNRCSWESMMWLCLQVRPAPRHPWNLLMSFVLSESGMNWRIRRSASGWDGSIQRKKLTMWPTR